MSDTHYTCPCCGTHGPCDVDDQEEDYIVLTCPVCGCEFQPPEAGETYEAESSFEEQFENSQFAQDEYPNGYEDDGNDFFGDE